MRSVMICVSVLAGLQCFSQTEKKLNLDPGHPLYRYDLRSRLLKKDTALLQFPRTHIQQGIISLPQDGMPCLVPPPAVAGLIPNPWTKSDAAVIGRIPNPGSSQNFLPFNPPAKK